MSSLVVEVLRSMKRRGGTAYVAHMEIGFVSRLRSEIVTMLNVVT